jgi:hypothetical protein
MERSTLESVRSCRYWDYLCSVSLWIPARSIDDPGGCNEEGGEKANFPVVGYGIGPLFLAPITEIPQIGRNLPYIVPLAIFCLLQIPTALVNNFAGFCILRFVAGFVSSPPLATGGKFSLYCLQSLRVTFFSPRSA